MNSILLVGMNHTTAPIELRECLAFDPCLIPSALDSMVDHEVIDEGVILSTCNRVELIAVAPNDSQKGIEKLEQFFVESQDIHSDSITKALYAHTGREAVKHIFRVASSLDSMVVGEPQILGQFKDAYNQAVSAGTVGRILSKLMTHAVSVAKRIRSETGISLNPVSVSSVAVELACKVFDDLSKRNILLIGAGEMAELAAKTLIETGAGRFVVANRTYEKAVNIAGRFRGEAVRFESLFEEITRADIVLCSTGAPEYVIRSEDLRHIIKKRRRSPLLFIDISVPRNVDPAVTQFDEVFVFDIDDLKSVADVNAREREREAAAADRIIDDEVERFLSNLRSLEIGPSVVEIKQMLSEMAIKEFHRQRKRLGNLTPEQEEAIKAVLIPSLINKLSHPMIVHLRARAREGQRTALLEELRKMLHLE